jgi:hypothetical protein
MICLDPSQIGRVADIPITQDEEEVTGNEVIINKNKMRGRSTAANRYLTKQKVYEKEKREEIRQAKQDKRGHETDVGTEENEMKSTLDRFAKRSKQ